MQIQYNTALAIRFKQIAYIKILLAILIYMIMKAHRKKIIKKNIFEFDDQEMPDESKAEPQSQKNAKNTNTNKSQKFLEIANEMYNPNKLKQNECYIGKKDEVKTGEEGKQNEILTHNGKYRKTMKVRRKHLFSDDQKQSVGEQRIQQKGLELGIQSVIEDSISKKIQQENNMENVNIFECQQTQEVATIKQQIEDKQGRLKQQHKNLGFISDFTSSCQQDNQQENSASSNQGKKEQKKSETKKSEETSETQSQIKDFGAILVDVINNIQKLKQKIYEPVPKGCRAFCVVKRVQNRLSQSFILRLQKDQEPLLYCQNQKGSIGANYYISLEKKIDRNKPAYLGKLRGNSIGSEYHLYTSGKAPQRSIDRKQWRISLGKIQYQSNFMGMNGPRRLQAFIPKIESIQQFDSFKITQQEECSLYKSSAIRKFRNKQPQWLQLFQSYALNFGGRVKQASIKNFILIPEQTITEQQFLAPDTMMFGKISKETYNLQVTYPLSIYQAFGIAISQFDFKFNCQ